ncbi:P-loop containing nucleoside triphosphate hydrolase protein [Phellopilus nigrolimitatus]|nr:P-loop containing nucleoside triphosphate hydrolase protein [Phellopilus nigrolimitatus]
MEDFRKKLTQSGATELFPAKGGQLRKVSKTLPISSDNSIITISSAESSPVIEHSRQRSALPSAVNKATVIVDLEDSDAETQGDNVKPTKQAKRLVWSDDEEAPAGLVSQMPGSKTDPTPFKMPPTTIKAPSNPPPSLRASASNGPVWETFDEPAVDNLYDPKKTAAEAERELQDLLSTSMNDSSAEIDMRLSTVNGFHDEIKLLPHQVLGRVWMAERETGKKNGGILADDMGLGKTIQTLTRIVDGRPRKADRDAGFAASTIVVCPVALVSQWAQEISKMAVGLRVIEHHGPTRTANPDVLKRAHVVITSYSVLSSEYGAFEKRQLEKASAKSKSRSKDSSDDDDDDSLSDETSNFGRTVAKKKASGKPKKIMDALFHLKWWRIALVKQNNVEELFSLLKFLRIRPLNDWETFNNQINKPVKSGKSVRAMKRLQVVLKAVMLRRKKDTVLNGKPIVELPDRKINIVTCLFDVDERDFYSAIESKVELTLNKFLKNGEQSRNYTSMLVLLLRLRQGIFGDFAEDKEAVDPKPAKDGKDLEDADDLADIFGQMDVSSARKCQMCQTILTALNAKDAAEAQYCFDCEVLASRARRKSLALGVGSLPPDSAKIRMILQILRDIKDRTDGEEKTIIFSQFTSMLDLVQPFLRSEGLKVYDGSMRKDQREESLAEIRNSKTTKIILISFKAGSTGLNLTACNNVILVDMWWNPALEDQAFDRAHRFGQTRNVNIYKLTIEQTVEERILALQEKKRELAAAALSGDKLKNSRLGLEDLMALFKSGGRDEDDEDDD